MIEHGRHTRRCRRQGFTLLELSVVLALIGVILGGALVVLTASVQTSQLNATVDRLNALDAALLSYRVAFNRLPCPADQTRTPTDVNYGQEAGWNSSSSPGVGTGVCTGTTMVPAANWSNAATGGDTVAAGAVPTRALRLPDSYMYDGWGRRFHYAVDVTMTAANAFVNTAIYPAICSPIGIQVTDASGYTSHGNRTSSAVYALVSFGANGHGGYTANGVPVNAGSVNANELANCNCNSSALARDSSSYSPNYVQMLPTVDTTNPLDDFDDIVSYKTLAQLQTESTNEAVGSCLTGGSPGYYIVDSGNSRIQNCTSTGSCTVFASGYGYANGQFSSNLWGVAMDSGGNLWVADTYNDRIQEFNSSGIFVKSIPPSASLVCSNAYIPRCVNQNTAGNFGYPKGVAVDANGYVWVADTLNSRLQKCTAAGVCTVVGTPGIGVGNFNQPTGIAVDASGNIWVADTSNNRVVEVNNAGTVFSSFGSSGSSAGQFSTPAGIAVDASGNIWVADTGNKRIQKCTAGGSCAVYGSSGNGPGQFNAPQGITVDSTGNIWVSDSGNVRINEFTSNGSAALDFSGNTVNYYGSSGSGTGQFNTPQGMLAIPNAVTPGR